MITNIYLKHESTENDTPAADVQMLSTGNEVYSKEDIEIVNKTDACVKEAVTHNSKFDKITLTSLPTVYVGNRADINRLSERENPDWVIGANTHNGIVLLDPRLYKNKAEKYGRSPETWHEFSEDKYSKTIRHEIGHLYFDAILGTSRHGNVPFTRWLNEGCQRVASEQSTMDKISYDKFEANILQPHNGMSYFYWNSEMAVKRLVEVFGQDKFIDNLHILLSRTGQELIKGETDDLADPEKVFNDGFQELFGFKLNKENLEEFVKTGKVASDAH
jgi:hypothetical protein